jgi:hypothetical protein
VKEYDDVNDDDAQSCRREFRGRYVIPQRDHVRSPKFE